MNRDAVAVEVSRFMILILLALFFVSEEFANRELGFVMDSINLFYFLFTLILFIYKSFYFIFPTNSFGIEIFDLFLLFLFSLGRFELGKFIN